MNRQFHSMATLLWNDLSQNPTLSALITNTLKGDDASQFHEEMIMCLEERLHFIVEYVLDNVRFTYAKDIPDMTAWQE